MDTADGARERLAATVAALRRPAIYPHQIGDVSAIETHMSWVFLTDLHAYKLKKPIRTRHFDHTTVEARRRACEMELRLNRRLAATVYVGVVPVVATAGGLGVDVPGVPIDWLVKMRRLPRDRMLDACIERRAVRHEEVDQLAATLTRFYETAMRAGWSTLDYRARILRELESKRAILEQARYGLCRADVLAANAGQLRWLAQHGELLGARAAAVIDAHGDLRPEHVCLETEPVIIDCLEFDRELRLLDPVSELSFLTLECRRLGAEWIGERILGGYAERTGDHPPETLVRFYQSYHAVVRATVAVWHLDDDALGQPDSWRERGTLYLQIARELL